MELKRVVVTGLGAVTPVGNTPEETWNNLINGKSGAASYNSFQHRKNSKPPLHARLKTSISMSISIAKKLVSSIDTLNWLSLVQCRELKTLVLI